MRPEHILPLIGAGAFGALIGWFVYYINRYRKGDVQFSDITTLVGVIGGGTSMALFQSEIPGLGKAQMFGAYGVGLFLGFFGYFVLLLILVGNSGGVFTWTWFLDGRRKNPKEGEGYPGGTPPPDNRPMDERMAIVEDRISRLSAPQAGASVAELTFQAPQAFSVSDDSPKLLETVNATAANVLATCEKNWEANKSDCSAFVKAVAEALGITGLDGNADQITATIMGAGWRKLADGVEAKQAADAGQLVIGGLRGSEHNPVEKHGHVVVVVTGGLAHKKYPTAYWGSLGGIGKKNSTVNFSWQVGDRDKVHYAAKSIA